MFADGVEITKVIAGTLIKYTSVRKFYGNQKTLQEHQKRKRKNKNQKTVRWDKRTKEPIKNKTFLRKTIFIFNQRHKYKGEKKKRQAKPTLKNKLLEA